MRARVVPAILLVLLLLVLQWQLWSGRGSLPDVTRMESKLAQQKEANAKAAQANERLQAEVNDLQQGQEMVEERARQELGMVKPNEILVQTAK